MKGVRRFLKKFSFRAPRLVWKLMAINLIPLGVILWGFASLDQYKEMLIQEKLMHLTQQVHALAAGLSASAVKTETGGKDNFSPLLAREPALLFLRRLIDPWGSRLIVIVPSREVFVDTAAFQGPAPEKFELLPDEAKTVLEGGDLWRVSEHPEETEFFVAVPIERYQRVVGGLILQNRDLTITQHLAWMRRGLLELFGFAGALSLILSVYLAFRIGRPIQKLSGFARAITERRLVPKENPKISRLRRDEIGQLQRAFWRMTQSLGKKLSASEDFIADVTHELKNPIASLKSALETLPKLKDPAQSETMMKIMRGDIDRLNRLMNSIRDAAEVEAQMGHRQFAQLSISALLQDLVEAYRLTRLKDGPQLVFHNHAAKSVKLWGDTESLTRLFRNLIDNAIDFSKQDDTITVDLNVEKDHVKLTLNDEGQGIPPGREERIFERFYTDRPQSQKPGHSGLGLALCRDIVRAHEGEIFVENRADNGCVVGARFVVKLPLK